MAPPQVTYSHSQVDSRVEREVDGVEACAGDPEVVDACPSSLKLDCAWKFTALPFPAVAPTTNFSLEMSQGAMPASVMPTLRHDVTRSITVDQQNHTCAQIMMNSVTPIFTYEWCQMRGGSVGTASPDACLSSRS